MQISTVAVGMLCCSVGCVATSVSSLQRHSDPNPTKPAPSASAPSPSAGDVELCRQIARSRHAIARCWETMFQTIGELTVPLRASVQGRYGEQGQVRDVRLIGSAPGLRDIEACLEQEVAGWKLREHHREHSSFEIPLSVYLVNTPVIPSNPSTSDVESGNDGGNVQIVSQDELLSRLRTVFQPPLLLQSVRSTLPCGNHASVYRLCVRPDGRVRSVNTRTSLPGADEKYSRYLRSLRFSPQDREVCADISMKTHLDRPASECRDPSQTPVEVPSDYLVHAMGSTSAPDSPSRLGSMQPCHRAHGIYRICVGTSGQVEQVAGVETVAGQDTAILSHIKTWKFRPLAVPVCYLRHLSFRGYESCPIEAEENPVEELCAHSPVLDSSTEVSSTFDGSWRFTPALPTELTVSQEPIDADKPLLRADILLNAKALYMYGTYRICVDRSGWVSRVDTIGSIPGADASILATLATRRYPPQPVEHCLENRIVVTKKD